MSRDLSRKISYKLHDEMLNAYSRGLLVPHESEYGDEYTSWPDSEAILSSVNASQDTGRLTEYVRRITAGKVYSYGAKKDLSIRGGKVSYPHRMQANNRGPPHPSMSDEELLLYLWPNGSIKVSYAGVVYIDVGQGDQELVEVESGVFKGVDINEENWVDLFEWPVMVGSNRCNMAVIRSYLGTEYDERARYILEELTRCEITLPDGYYIIEGKMKKINIVDRLQMNVPYTIKITDTPAVRNIVVEIRSLDPDIGIETHNIMLRPLEGKGVGVFVNDIYKFYNSAIHILLTREEKETLNIYNVVGSVGIAYDMEPKDAMDELTKVVTQFSNNDPEIMRIMSLTYVSRDNLDTKEKAELMIEHFMTKKDKGPKEVFLPRCHTFESKVRMVAIMIIDLVRVLMKKQDISDLKDFIFKRWDTSGHRMKDHLRNVLQSKSKSKSDIAVMNKNMDSFTSILSQNKWPTSYKPYRRKGKNDEDLATAIVNDAPIYNNVALLDSVRMNKIGAANTGNTAATRRVHTSQYGFQCPANTPENENIGLNNELAEDVLISEDLTNDERDAIDEMVYDEKYEGDILLLYEGEPISFVDESLYYDLIDARDSGRINKGISITLHKMWDYMKVINVKISYGRPLLPLLRLGESISMDDIGTWDEMVEKRMVQHLDAYEISHNTVIAEWIYAAVDRMEDNVLYLKKKYTHSCIMPTSILSQASNSISYIEHNPGARGTYATLHIKQAIAHPFLYPEDRWDHEANDIKNPESPLISTRTCRRLGMTSHQSPYIPGTKIKPGYGVNANVAFISNFGNYDDAIHISQRMVDKGMLVGDHYDIFVSNENISVNNQYNVIVEKQKNIKGEMEFVEVRRDGIGMVDPIFSDSVIVPYETLPTIEVEELGTPLYSEDRRVEGLTFYEIEDLYIRYGSRYNLIYTYRDDEGNILEREYPDIDRPLEIPGMTIIDKRKGALIYIMALAAIRPGTDHDMTFISKVPIVVDGKKYLINRGKLPIPRTTIPNPNRPDPFSTNEGRPVAIVRRRQIKRGDSAIKILNRNDKGVIVGLKNEKFSATFGTILKIERGTITRISVAMPIKPEPGNKYAALYAQKGVCAMIIPADKTPKAIWHNPVTGKDEEMEIDIVFNSLGIPSRMTTGMEYELYIAGTLQYMKSLGLLDVYEEDRVAFDDEMEGYGVENASDLIDYLSDSTPFVYDNVEKKGRCKELRQKLGIPDDGMYNMVYPDGKKIENKIACGTVYYVALRHLVDNKRRARGYVGKRDPFTYQPVKGRRKDGGSSWGLMEADVGKAYGARSILWERLNKVSDGRTVWKCSLCGGLCSKSGDVYKCHKHDGELLPSQVYAVDTVQSWELFRHYMHSLGLNLTEHFE